MFKDKHEIYVPNFCVSEFPESPSFIWCSWDNAIQQMIFPINLHAFMKYFTMWLHC